MFNATTGIFGVPCFDLTDGEAQTPHSLRKGSTNVLEESLSFNDFCPLRIYILSVDQCKFSLDPGILRDWYHALYVSIVYLI